MKLAEQIVSQLIEAGVSRIYGVVGDSLNPIVDAVRASGGSAKGGIDWIHVRHEEAAAFAAAADAEVTGELAVCAGSCGPGNTHRTFPLLRLAQATSRRLTPSASSKTAPFTTRWL